MNANELRIGSLVYFNGKHQEIGVVSGITTDLITEPRVYINDRIDIPYQLSSLKPIPLTEDWLFKFGFPKEELIITEHQTHFTLGNIKIWIPFDKFLLDTYRIEIIHVHQLQNLYFALTNTELIWIGEK